MNTTADRFRRKLGDRQHDPEYACAIERMPPATRGLIGIVGDVCLACLIGMGLAAALVAWWGAP